MKTPLEQNSFIDGWSELNPTEREEILREVQRLTRKKSRLYSRLDIKKLPLNLRAKLYKAYNPII